MNSETKARHLALAEQLMSMREALRQTVLEKWVTMAAESITELVNGYPIEAEAASSTYLAIVLSAKPDANGRHRTAICVIDVATGQMIDLFTDWGDVQAAYPGCVLGPSFAISVEQYGTLMMEGREGKVWRGMGAEGRSYEKGELDG